VLTGAGGNFVIVVGLTGEVIPVSLISTGLAKVWAVGKAPLTTLILLVKPRVSMTGLALSMTPVVVVVLNGLVTVTDLLTGLVTMVVAGLVTVVLTCLAGDVTIVELGSLVTVVLTGDVVVNVLEIIFWRFFIFWIWRTV
jgi:hypothetical protein